MNWRKVIGLAGCLTVLTFLCVGALTWGAWHRYGDETPVEQALPPTAPDVADDAGGESGVNRIALVGEEGNIWTVSPTGGELQAITRDAAANTMAYRYPTWSPDAQRLAFVELALDETNSPQSALHIVSADGAEDTRVATAFSPFYLNWSPTSEVLAFLSSWPLSGMALQMLDVEQGAEQTREVMEGQPFYFSWRPDGQRLLAHIGIGRLVFLDREGEDEALNVRAGLFQAPHWSADGERLAYVSAGKASTNVLNVSDAEGENVRTVAEEVGLFTLNWSPDSQRIAYSFTEERVGLAAFGPLWVRALDGTHAWELSKMPVIAFFWSPDGKKVAFLRPDQSGPAQRSPEAAPLRQEQQIWLRWHIWDGERTYPLARFSPTDTFLLDYLRYFDQYAQSSSLWSPDSQTLLYAGTSEDGRAGIWTLPIAEKSTPQRVARGVLATWSPR